MHTMKKFNQTGHTLIKWIHTMNSIPLINCLNLLYTYVSKLSPKIKSSGIVIESTQEQRYLNIIIVHAIKVGRFLEFLPEKSPMKTHSFSVLLLFPNLNVVNMKFILVAAVSPPNKCKNLAKSRKMNDFTRVMRLPNNTWFE